MFQNFTRVATDKPRQIQQIETKVDFLVSIYESAAEAFAAEHDRLEPPILRELRIRAERELRKTLAMLEA